MGYLKRGFVLMGLGIMLLVSLPGCVVAPGPPAYVVQPPAVVIRPYRLYRPYRPYYPYYRYRPYVGRHPYRYRW